MVTIKDITDLNDSINNLSNVKEQGFSAPNAPGSDVGLPFTKVPYGVTAAQNSKRHLINWFVPDMGVVRMYVNPENISYSFRKAIQNRRTKGGYNIQYWGEELTTIALAGTTGSSGVEGINALYEVYRSEQYAFDAVGLTLSSNNAAENLANNIVGKGANYIGGKISDGIGGGFGAITGGITSALLSPASNALSPRNLPTLANHALTVEMYYMGWVFRGYFNSITVRETTDLLFSYDISFTATQRRGYRTNFLPWHKTPIGGGGNLGSHFDQDFNPASGNLGSDYNQSTGTATSSQYSFNKKINTR
jgi:hypothetical protein